MTTLPLLRKLAEYQQHRELRDTALNLWRDTQEPEILPLLALAYGQLGEREAAERHFGQACQYQPDYNADSLVDLAATAILLRGTGQAVKLLEQALSQQSCHALGLARLGYCRLQQMELDAARDLFQQALDIEPGRIPVLTHLAHVHFCQSDYDAAQQEVDRGLEVLRQTGPDLPIMLSRQYSMQLNTLHGQILVAQKNYDQAERWLQEQFSCQQGGKLEEEDFVHCLTQYARQLAEQDRHQQAEDILREYRKHYPANSSLCLHLSELCQIQGHFLQSVNLIQTALKHDKDNISLWVKLASVSLHRSGNKARQAATKAVELAEALKESDEQSLAYVKIQRSHAHNAMAQVESHEQHFDIAEQLFRDILREHEHFVPALQGLGQQQMQRGNIDEAVALFERVKRLDPLKGHAALINARSFPEDVQVLEKIEQAAKIPSLEGPLRTGLLFQLAAAWEKRGEYDKAFEFARLGNLGSKKFLSYDSREHRNRCARIRYGFCEELYRNRQNCGVDSTVPVYVVGMPRSGTTLVEQIIAGHSGIFGAGELGLIPQVVQGLNRWERHVGSGRCYPDCVDDLSPNVTEGIANNVLRELRELAPEAKHVVDKLPHNFENIGLIKFLFPKARIISVRRDPRDIAISNYFTDYQAKHSGMGFAYDLTNIGEQLADHNLMMHHWHQVFPGEILEVHYEDIIDDMKANAHRILEYIGVPWEDQVLDFDRLKRPVKTASVWQVRQPIYKSSKARWKHYQKHLGPLLEGTNRSIRPDPVEMLTLPEPGFLTEGVDLYQAGDLDGAELNFKKLLHHNPEHRACHYMLGLVYLSKGYAGEGIEHIEKAIEKVPWQREWRDNLLKAYEQEGLYEKARAFRAKYATGHGKSRSVDEHEFAESNSNGEILTWPDGEKPQDHY